MRARAGFIRFLVAAIALLLSCRVPDVLAADGPAYKPGEVLVKFRSTVSTTTSAAVTNALGSDVVETFPKLGVERLRLSHGTVEDAVARLKREPSVEFAEPNYIYHVSGIPNDPSFPLLWGLQNTGQTGGTPGDDIHAPQAWSTFTGSPSVLVGVVDTGADYTHPDLAANMWVNPGEIPGNGMDDDGNGFIDDVHGWDFANNDNDPMDDHFHGTHVSGTIGAVGNNGIGVVGVNWTVRIMPIKFLDAGGSGSTDAAIHAIDYATMMGVKVINASWGGGGYSEALRLSIQAAGNAGVLFVAAAGNAGTNTDINPNYPSSYDLDNIVAVAATDANDQLASFSNYGVQSVDLGAPGVNVYSTFPGNSYGTLSGTSMATPHVVGVAALIRGRIPAATVAVTKALLLNRAQPRPGLQGLVLTGGRLDALMSIADPDSIPPGPITDLVTSDPNGSRITLHWTANGDDGATGTAFAYDVRYSTSPITAQNFDAAAQATGEPVPSPAGTSEQMVVTGLAFNTAYYFALRSIDEFANLSPLSNNAFGTTLGPPDIAISPTSLSETLLTGATSTQHLTVTNTGVSDLEFTVERALADSGLAIDVITGKAGVPDKVLATGTVVPLASLARIAAPFARTIQVGDHGTPDGLGVIRTAAVAPGRRVLSPQEEVFGNTDNAFFGGPRSRGNIFECTKSRTLHEHRLYIGPAASTQLWFLVYEGLSAAGSYSLVSASNVTPAGPGTGWYSSGTIDLPMTEGRFYLIVASFEQQSAYYNQLDISPYPIPASFGNLITGAGWFWAPTANFPPDPTQVVPAEAYGDHVAYYQTLLTNDGITWVSANPETASVAAGSQLDVAVLFDAAGKIDGDYDAKLVFNSNDPDESSVPVPVHLHVIGAADILVSPTAIDFGSPFVGATPTDTVVVSNPGTATLNISGVTASPGVFTVDPSGFALAPGAAKKLAVTFAPVVPGPYSGTLSIASDDPDEALVTVALSGVGLIAPDIAVSPDSLSADLLSGEQATRTVTIANTGGSDLTYQVSITGDVAAASVRVVVTPPDPGPLPGGGEGGRSDRMPAGYQRTASLYARTAGTHVLLIQDFLPWGSPANTQILAANGIAFDVINSSQLAATDLTQYRDVIVASDQPTSTYATLAARAAQIDAFVLHGGSLEFHAAGNGFNGGDPTVVTLPGGMHIVNSFANYNYVLLPGHPTMVGVPNPFSGNYASHAAFSNLPAGAEIIVQDEHNLPNLVAYRHGSGHVIAAGQTLEYGYMNNQGAGIVLRNLIPFVAEGGGVGWLTAAPTEGTVPPGGSAQITVTFDATDLLGGDYRAGVAIDSNDPDETSVIVPALLHVTGVPRIAVLGRAHEVQSTATYSTPGASTHHTLALPSVPGTEGSLRLDTEGDYNDVGEFATVIVEGVNIGHAGEKGFECTRDSTTFGLTDAQLQQFGADRSVQVTVANSPTVDAYCLTNSHTVRFRYRDPGDVVDFGLRFLGTCRSETLEVKNPGTDTLIVNSIVSSSPRFVVSVPNLRLGPGASALLGLTFCPIATGPTTGTLTLLCNDPDAGSVSVALRGGGANPPDIAVAPSSLEVELLSGTSLTHTLTVSNTGGPLLWSAFTSAPQAAVVVDASPKFEGQAEDLVPKEVGLSTKKRDPSRQYATTAALGTALGPLPVPGPPPSGGSLENVLASLDAQFGAITAAIPNRYDFFEGVFGYSINDGGNDMYDDGNYLSTNLGGYLPYSDGVIQGNPILGPHGRYFTRKYPGLFVLVADLDGVSTFNIDGNLGADGFGFVDGAVLDVAQHGSYRGFVKRVYNAFDPSVNHLVIVPGGASATHDFAVNTNDDHHSVHGPGNRIYYLLYAGADGGYIDNAATVNVFNAFLGVTQLSGALAVSPMTGGVPDGGSVDLTVTFDSHGLNGGNYEGQVVVASNDPDENPVTIPTHMHVIGVPDIAAIPDSIDFGPLFVGGTTGDSVVVRNVGTDTLVVSGVSAAPGAFAVDPSGFVLGPGAAHLLAVSFHPTAAVPVVGALSIASNDPDEGVFTVPLTGQGLIAPDIAVSPDSIGVDLPGGGQAVRTLTVSNTGGSDLTFDVTIVGNSPPDSFAVAHALASLATAAGPAAASDRAPAGYVAEAPRAVASPGARVLLIQDILPWGSNANALILNANGILFDAIAANQLAGTNLAAYRTVIVASDQPQYVYDTLVARAAQIESFVLLGGVLEFHAAGWGYGGGSPSVVTLPGGMHIAQYYSSINYVLDPGHPIMSGVPNPFTGTSASHAFFSSVPAGADVIASDDVGRPDLVEYHHGAGRVIAAGQTLEYGAIFGQHSGIVLHNLIPYAASAGLSWLSAEPTSGIVPAGGSIALTLTFDPTDLPGGDYRAAIRLDSNDPDENPVLVPVRMLLNEVSDIAVVPDSIDFGSVFLGASPTRTLEVHNGGLVPLSVSSVSASPGVFTADPSGFVVDPGGVHILIVGFTPAAVGPVVGGLTIASDDPDEPLVTVQLTGRGLIAPDIAVSPDSLSADLLSGAQTTRSMTVANTGGSDLSYAVAVTGDVSGASLRVLVTPPADAGANGDTRSDRAPAGYQAPASQARVAPRTNGVGAHVLLVQDVLPWGSEANNSVLEANGIPYDVVNSNQLAGLNLSAYDDLIVAGDQPTPTYQRLTQRAAQIDSFVVNGGTLEFHAAGWGFAGGNPTGVTLPGGMHIVNSYSSLNDVLLPGHPLVAGVPDPFTGNLASHAGFTSIPDGAELIVRDDHGIPNLVSYVHGLGRVVASGQTLERGFSYGEPAGRILQNLIPYDAHGGVSWLTAAPRTGTVAPGSSVLLTVTFDATGLLAGDYRAFVEVDSDDPDESAVKVPARLSVFGAATVSVEEHVAKFELAPVTPTPARGGAFVEFELTRPGVARVMIFDVAGKLVRTLAQGPQEAGRHRLAWRGEDDRGAQRRAGVYLLKLDSEEGQRTRRIVFVP